MQKLTDYFRDMHHIAKYIVHKGSEGVETLIVVAVVVLVDVLP